MDISAITKKRIDKILSSPDEIKISGTAYYVANDGDEFEF